MVVKELRIVKQQNVWNEQEMKEEEKKKVSRRQKKVTKMNSERAAKRLMVCLSTIWIYILKSHHILFASFHALSIRLWHNFFVCSFYCFYFFFPDFCCYVLLA